MATDSKGRWPKAGLGAIIFSAIGLLLDLLGLPEDLDRWRLIMGQVVVEGLSVGLQQLALLVGLMLATPWILEAISKRILPRLQQRQAARALAKSAETVLPYLNRQELSLLSDALKGRVSKPLPGKFGWKVWESGELGADAVYLLRPEVRKPVEKFFAEREREWRERRKADIVKIIQNADRPARTVLWAFGAPRIQEPLSALRDNSLLPAVRELAEAGVLKLSYKTVWSQGHSPFDSYAEEVLSEVHLTEEACPAVSEILFEGPVRRTSVRVLGGE